jgi:hypothetical protein
MKDYSLLDPALEFLEAYGHDLRNGLTNHAPMAVEALSAMGRADAVMPWLEAYREGMLPRPPARERIPRDDWRSALGRTEREADWGAFFAEELAEGPWREVLARWTGRLTPGICGSATHGVIRVGHAVRSLDEAESPARIRELGGALASWTANYQTLPTNPGSRRSDFVGDAHRSADRRARGQTRERAPGTLGVREAIAAVPVVPPAERRFTGTIVSSLAALDDFPAFAGVIDLLDVRPEPSSVISELTETFARVYLANAHDSLHTIVFVHGVTSAAALRSILPHLSAEAAREAIRYQWQSGCALYAAFGEAPAPPGAIEPPRESRDPLVDLAISSGDEHAIKFTEACLREHDLNPSPAYLAAARHAIGALQAD